MLTGVMVTAVSTGGNAGMAAAYVARKMGLSATVVVPSSTPPLVVRRLQEQGAAVKVAGKVRAVLRHVLWVLTED